MAAIYSGIHLKLKSPHTSWEDKLKLARFAWISSQCLLPNKEQVLLDWCAHALTGWYNQKVKFSSDVLEGLWCYLDDLLHSKKLHSALKQGKTISLRLNLVQLLLDRLQVCSDSAQLPECTSTILSVCQRVLSSPSLSSVFTTKYELMVSLLVKVCNLACSELQNPKLTGGCQLDVTRTISKSDTIASSAHLFELLLQVLSSYLSVQRQQANQNRVFTSVTNQLFQLLIFLRHLMTSGELPVSHPHLRACQHLSRDVRVKIDLIIQSALFPPEHLTYYKEELCPPVQDSGKRGPGGAKGPLKPVTTIMSKLTTTGGFEPSLHYTVKSSTVPLLFKFFLENFRKGRKEVDEEQGMLCFYFLSRLFVALDVTVNTAPPAKVVQQKSPESWSLALLAVESLLTMALSENIYNIAADRIRHNEVQLKFYKSFAQALLNQAQPSIPAWYRCLKVLLNLNHLILEPDLDQLLSLAWVDAECNEARSHRAQQLLLCSLIQIYSKLRQLPRLFSELLSVICQSTLDQKQPSLLSDEVSSCLRSCVQDTPASLGLEMCSLVLESIKTSLLPELAEGCGATETMDVDGGGGEKEAASRKIYSLSQLLHVVLFSLKTLDNASPLPLVRRCERLMTEMQQTIQNLLTPSSCQKKSVKTKGKKNRNSIIGKMWEEKIQEAALLLKYTLMEVDTLFGFHCTKYSSASQCVTEEHSNDDDVSLLPALIPSSCSAVISLHLKLLTLQQVKKAMLDGPLVADKSTASLTKAAQFILAKDELEDGLHGEQVWDGQITSVTAGSYQVAHWYVVTSNLPLIAPHLSGNDLSSIANILIESLLSSPAEGKDPLPGSLTIPIISTQLLQSSIFAELPQLFSTSLASLAQRICRVLTSVETSQVFCSLKKFKEALRSVDGEMERGQLLSSLVHSETLAEDILKSRNSEVFVALTEAQIEELTKLLQIFNELNPDGISPQDLSSVFLLLLFILTCTSADDPAFVVKLLKVLHLLLEARNFQCVLKLVHGGSLLETVVSSLFCHRRADPNAVSGRLETITALQAFILSLTQFIIARSSSVRLNLDQFASFLASKDCSRQPDLHILLASLTSFSQSMASNLGRNKVVDQTLTQTLKRTTSVMGPALDSLLTSINQGESLPSPTFLVEVVNVMLHCEVSSMSVEEERSEEQLELSHSALYQNFYQRILDEINSDSQPIEFYSSCLRFLSLFYAAMEKTVRRKGKAQEEGEEPGAKELDELFLQILQNVNRLLSAPGLSSCDLGQLEPAVQELLRHLVGKSSTSRFMLLLQMIQGGLDPGKLLSGNYREVLSAIIIIKGLSCCVLPDDCSRALWHVAPQILSATVYLVTSSSQELSLTLPFTIPVVTAMTSLLRQGEGLLTNSHHVILVLGALHSVPLDRLPPLTYQSAFWAIHEALFAIIQCHPKVISKAAASFLNVFYRLVASIMQEGRQRGDSDSDSDVYLPCSRLIERMYSHIAAIPETFSCQPVFMVAQYVTELQKVTLRPDIKLHLTEGIYCILDLCMEQDIKFLMAGLQAGVREVFNELYSSYTHYHKTQRQGEEKYTV
ncbi:unhealthy ribosome biogenesis protein 2 homolog [Synchiropus splendidus]|uniref:unhealthy ribosome biogenesis protein 2 homolog n=1 Tax=Synchiropus splendidus TaxID=270530 RepID=UPI00237E3B6A|nr:unhealthy ribosome biogenesis protein 2 homolog [Synchiropus splendidus]XP_053722404.1 unhealthy ribosome biogenesis protein 2 homolog [Synchiropus splendidus]